MESLSIIYNPQKEIQKQKTIRAAKLKLQQWNKKRKINN